MISFVVQFLTFALLSLPLTTVAQFQRFTPGIKLTTPVLTTPDGTFAIGTSPEGTPTLLNFNPLGSIQWSKQLVLKNGAQPQITCLYATSDGHLLIAGGYKAGTAVNRHVVSKLDLEGNIQFTSVYYPLSTSYVPVVSTLALGEDEAMSGYLVYGSFNNASTVGGAYTEGSYLSVSVLDAATGQVRSMQTSQRASAGGMPEWTALTGVQVAGSEGNILHGTVKMDGVMRGFSLKLSREGVPEWQVYYSTGNGTFVPLYWHTAESDEGATVVGTIRMGSNMRTVFLNVDADYKGVEGSVQLGNFQTLSAYSQDHLVYGAGVVRSLGSTQGQGLRYAYSPDTVQIQSATTLGPVLARNETVLTGATPSTNGHLFIQGTTTVFGAPAQSFVGQVEEDASQWMCMDRRSIDLRTTAMDLSVGTMDFMALSEVPFATLSNALVVAAEGSVTDKGFVECPSEGMQPPEQQSKESDGVTAGLAVGVPVAAAVATLLTIVAVKRRTSIAKKQLQAVRSQSVV